MQEVMLSLGGFSFGVSTTEYQSIKTVHAWRWAKKDRLGRKASRQFHGADASTKQLEISIYPQSAADLSHFRTLKAMGDRGEPLRLISGGSSYLGRIISPQGADLGLWALEKLSIDESMFMRNGTALQQKGILSIAEYGEDSIGF